MEISVTVFQGSLLLLFSQIYNSYTTLKFKQLDLFYKNLNLCLVTNQSNFISKHYFLNINMKEFWSTRFPISSGLEDGLQKTQLPKKVGTQSQAAPVTVGVCNKYFLIWLALFVSLFVFEEVSKFQPVLVQDGSQKRHQIVFLIILDFFAMDFQNRLVPQRAVFWRIEWHSTQWNCPQKHP